MNYSKILTSLFLGMFLTANAQNDNSDKNLLAGGEKPEIIARNLDQNTVVYSYSGKAKKNNIETKKEETLDKSRVSSSKKNDVYQYPVMRNKEGAILPFEIIIDGKSKSTLGMMAQEHYFNSLMVEAEKNKIIYQDLETTRKRLNDAGIFDAHDMNYFDRPLIAKIVGAGVLITGKVMINTRKSKETTDTVNSSEEYNTEVIFTVYNKNGKAIYTKREAPITATTIDSYHATLNHMMKQTPYYYH